jgi:glycosyltransferase domain-containing protein
MPTYNRHNYALRAIRFWSNTDVHLIVIDGTSEPLSADIVKEFPDNITYISDSSSWTNRMKIGAGRSSTEYSALISDDEFFLPSSLIELIQALDDQQSVVSAIGHVLRFYPYKQSVLYQYSYPEFKTASILEKDSMLRVQKHLHPYRVTSLYAVTRTDCFRKNIAVADICSRFPNSASFEVGFEIANAYQGEIIVLPIVSWLRSNENPPNWNSKTVSIYDWWSEEKDSESFFDAATLVQDVLDSEINLQLNDRSRTILHNGFEAYSRNQEKVTLSRSSRVKLKLKKRIREYISNDLVFGLKLKFPFFVPNGHHWISLKEIPEQLKLIDLSVNTSEIYEISEFVLKERERKIRSIR